MTEEELLRDLLAKEEGHEVLDTEEGGGADTCVLGFGIGRGCICERGVESESELTSGSYDGGSEVTLMIMVMMRLVRKVRKSKRSDNGHERSEMED